MVLSTQCKNYIQLKHYYKKTDSYESYYIYVHIYHEHYLLLYNLDFITKNLQVYVLATNMLYKCFAI